MVGLSALRECIVDDSVQEIVTIGRKHPEQEHIKLKSIELEDVTDLQRIEHELNGFDTCLFCLGVSSQGMKEEEYRRITYDITLSVAETLVRLNPLMIFLYVSGSGTDSSERGRSMWARVKGKTENDLLRLPFKAAYMFRPGIILPSNGVKSKTKMYKLLYDVLRPFYPILRKLKSVVTSEQLGKAMIKVVLTGYPNPIIEANEIKKIV
jgi:hypothetical protein